MALQAKIIQAGESNLAQQQKIQELQDRLAAAERPTPRHEGNSPPSFLDNSRNTFINPSEVCSLRSQPLTLTKEPVVEAVEVVVALTPSLDAESRGINNDNIVDELMNLVPVV